MCQYCDKTSMEELNLHIKVVHEKEENEQRQALLCDKCFECFESERMLNLHVGACHQKESVSITLNK